MWLFTAYLFIVFLCFGFVFGNLNALAMELLGHLAGVGAAVVSSVSILVAVPLGTLVSLGFDGTMYAQIGAFAAIRWAAGGGVAGTGRAAGAASP